MTGKNRTKEQFQVQVTVRLELPPVKSQPRVVAGLFRVSAGGCCGKEEECDGFFKGDMPMRGGL